MKSKLLIMATLLIAILCVNNVEADSEGGGVSGGCFLPEDNICMVVHMPFGMERTLKGHLKVTIP